MENDCPFCGSSGESLQVWNSLEGPAKVVKCLGCGAIGPYGASNPELAIAEWNRRTIKKVIITSSASSDNVPEASPVAWW